ncbi:MAG TPA: ATPase domain-containing protein, partial [Thermoanaerobaculia bacterium]|nr:ATPase domain-containing protein [Thermoanaerobaculia bacterium]
MAAPRTVYECHSCRIESPKCLGRCPDCARWSTFVEETRELPRKGKGGAAGGGGAAALTPLSEIEQDAVARVPSGLPQLDAVLGGGVVEGAAVLLAGEPGIGKSTLLLQLAERLAAGGRSVVYASAEESPR